jgi:serine/threonine protein kinase
MSSTQPLSKRKRPILKLDIDDINSEDGITDTESNTSTPITIPEHLQKLKSGMINYTYMSDGDFGDKFLGKIKQQYVKQKDKGLTLGVRLFYFKNKSINKDENGTFTKVFAYSNNPKLEPDNVLIKILSEVYYHIEFIKLQSTCNFRVPKLIEYGFIQHNNDENIKIDEDEFMFYIKMEDVDATPVTKLNELYDDTNVVLGKCIDIATEVNRINKCLLQNNLYHNDLHTDNVMIDKNGELIIIDFGESSNILQRPLIKEDFCSIFKHEGGANKKGRTMRKNRRMITKKMRSMSKNRRLHMSKKMRGMSKNRRHRRISKKRKI